MNTLLFTDTITLYNRYREGRTDKWQRTVIHNTQYREKVEKSVDAQGLHVAQTISLTIPVDADAGGRHYLSPTLFTGSEHRENYWTLDAAHGLDVIVLGECDAELSDAYTLDTLKAEHGYATLRAVTDNTVRTNGKHWKVIAE